MSNKWTIKKVIQSKEIKRGTLVDTGQLPGEYLSIVIDTFDTFSYTRDGKGLITPLNDNHVEDFKFYDASMNLISPPKEREYVVICEFWHKDTRVVKMLNEELTGLPFVKIPNGRRYKRYKDNGELEAIDE